MSGYEVWGRLDPLELRKGLDSEMLNILDALFGANEIPLKDDLDKLGEIYSFLNGETLSRVSFRKELFSLFYPEEINELTRKLNLDDSLNYNETLKKIIGIPWNDNDQACIIAEYINIPKFLLSVAAKSSDDVPNIIYPYPCKLEQFKESETNKQMILDQFTNRMPYKNLKSYQAEIYSRAKILLERNLERFVINMPTGTGKTRTAMQLVCEFFNENPHRSVVWVADKQELIDQACIEFCQIWEFIGNREIKIERWYSGQKKSKTLPESLFLATTFGTLLKCLDKISQIPVGLVVVDEAHMAVAPKWSKALEHLIQPNNKTRMIGLTATPIRGGGETKELIEFFHNNIIQITGFSGKYLIEWLETEQYLSGVSYDSIPSGVNIELKPEEVKKLKKTEGDYPLDFLIRLSKEVRYSRSIISTFIRLFNAKSIRKILFFGLTVEHSKIIVAWLRMNGYSAFHIDSKTDKNLRKAAISDFRDGDLNVLSNFGVLTTGFDAPKVDCIFIARPTASSVLYNQMIGRGLRGPKLGGTGMCKLIDVEVNIIHAEKRPQTYGNYAKAWREYSE